MTTPALSIKPRHIAAFRPAFASAPPVKAMINLGSLFDIPTGTFEKGRYGESILNGGLGNLTGIVGIGNNFKSTVMHYMFTTAMSRMPGSTGNTYDTEINIHEWHLKKMIDRNEEFNGEDVIATQRWVITDKTMYTGDQYYDILKESLQDKIKNKKDFEVPTPFVNREATGPMMILNPSFSEIDSLSEFVTQDVMKMQDNNSLGESGANMVFMRQGVQKNRFLMEIPGLAGSSYNYVLMTAHIGTEFVLDPYNPPPKKLQHLKGGVKIKGVPEKFTFAMNNCYHCYNAAPLINQGTKAPEYPRSSDDDMAGDTDLNVVTVRQLRSKSGPTGMATQLIVSQTEGVLPTLTEFHYLKENGRFGLEGNVQNYAMVLRPDVKLSRTVVRRKIDEDYRLRRAINLTADLCQLTDLRHDLKEFLVTPEELYKGLKEKGYDWEVLLDTRSFWTTVEDHPKPYLSIMDLLLMLKDQYVPYWLTDEQVPAACKDIPRKKVY